MRPCVGGVGSLPLPDDRRTFTSVAEAAKARSTDAVIDLLNRGHNVDTQDADGNTALHWAAWFRLDILTERLLERRAQPGIGNASGESAVHWAAKAANVPALNALTRGDAGLLTLRDCDGFTPFIICGQNDNAPVMEWMYLRGVDVEEQDNWGRTALQWACYKGHLRTVQWLLSRSASIMHRDLDGMTALHWAALRGHQQAADMLLNVGAAGLLQLPDSAGDTPLALAARKKNRYLVMSFRKCQLLHAVIGRPYISRNNFANLFVLFTAFNVLIFAFILAPAIADVHPRLVLVWAFLTGTSALLWVQNCSSDPGWIQPMTIHEQSADEELFESRTLHCGSLVQSDNEKYNKKGLMDGDGCAGKVCGAELQPLIGGVLRDCPSTHHPRLDRRSAALQEREPTTSRTISHERVDGLLKQGCGEYVTLVDKGEFKQVCVVCRARRKMRSHHCRECGRCVDRLDHHCPWIDNCVGLGNQRSFYCFIVTLLATLAAFYHVVVIYILDTLLPALDGHPSASSYSSMSELFGEAVDSLSSLGPCMQPVLVAGIAALNFVWLTFVAALVARHTAYMASNVTTYEVLVRPPHVQRRFPIIGGQLWFLQDLGLLQCMRRCLSYWTLNTDRDLADFLGDSAPQKSFMATLDDIER